MAGPIDHTSYRQYDEDTKDYYENLNNYNNVVNSRIENERKGDSWNPYLAVKQWYHDIPLSMSERKLHGIAGHEDNWAAEQREADFENRKKKAQNEWQLMRKKQD